MARISFYTTVDVDTDEEVSPEEYIRECSDEEKEELARLVSGWAETDGENIDKWLEKIYELYVGNNTKINLLISALEEVKQSILPSVKMYI